MSFSSLLDKARSELALTRIKERGAKVIDVALDVGSTAPLRHARVSPLDREFTPGMAQH